MISPESLLDHRKAGFPRFLEDAGPSLDDFLIRVGLPSASTSGFDYRKCADALGEWLRNQNIPQDNRAWITSSMGYFLGAYFINQHQGRWLVDEIPNSRFYGRYVIGDFPRANHLSSMVDPIQMAADYVSAPAGRDLMSLIRTVESTLVFKLN